MKITDLRNAMVIVPALKRMSGDMDVFPVVFQTQAEQEAQQRLYKETQSSSAPLPTWRDRAGILKTVFGDPLYDENPEMTSPTKLADDFTKLGFRLIVVELLRREGDDESQSLRMTWSRNVSSGIALSDKQKSVARKYADLFFWKHFGFYHAKAISLQGDKNPIQGSIANLIFSGIMKPKAVGQNDGLLCETRLVSSEGGFEFLSFIEGTDEVAPPPSKRWGKKNEIPLATLADFYDRTTSRVR